MTIDEVSSSFNPCFTYSMELTPTKATSKSAKNFIVLDLYPSMAELFIVVTNNLNFTLKFIRFNV